MAEKSKLLRALQRIAATARKIEPNSRPTPAIRPAPSVLVSLPEHKSLLPLLLSHDVPPRLAKACADRYDEYAGQLRLEAESELAPYLANRRKNQPAKVYTIFLNNYNQTLHRWSQSVLNTALKSLKRGSVELLDWEVTHPAPLWLPVGLSHMRIMNHADFSLAAGRPGICAQGIGGERAPLMPSIPTDCLIGKLSHFRHYKACPCVSDDLPSPASPSLRIIPSRVVPYPRNSPHPFSHFRR